MSDVPDIATLTLHESVDLLARGDLSAVTLTDAVLEAITAKDEALNAYVTCKDISKLSVSSAAAIYGKNEIGGY